MKGTPVVLGLAVIVAGCADTGRRVEYVAAQAPPPRAHVAVAPPPLVVVAPTQLRMVWVPEWGVYVLEGHDVVHYESAYYAYSGGYWWIAQSHAGPVGDRRAAADDREASARPVSQPRAEGASGG